MKSMVKVPKVLKPDFRRSVTKDKISTPISIPVKSSPTILPPKKVIKALYDYKAAASNELSFSKGDFFHVVGNENDPNWYEAYNPVTNVRGLVPVSYFQVLEKSGRLSGDHKSESNALLDVHNAGQKPQPLYGIVLYDFVAERPDELDAKAGEPIIVIAQSNHEWFVAKPIGRLGGPGLIPVAFIEIRDHATGKAIENIQELMDKSIVPKVEEWKKMTQDYQENSISLGRLGLSADSKLAPVGMDPVPVSYNPKLAPVSSAPFDNKLGLQDSAPYGSLDFSTGSFDKNSDASETLPTSPTQQSDFEDSESNPQDDKIISASVEMYHFEDERYWFLVRIGLASGCFRLLYRLYEDFYEFQIALLNKFPVEAGRTGEQRILPFMPGPLSYVNDMITAQRRADLDVYVKEEGDIETPVDPRQPNDISSALDASPVDPSMSYSTNQENQSISNGLYKHDSNPSLSGQSFNKSSHAHDESPKNASNLSDTPSIIKVKILYKDDLIAIRVASNVSYAQLREKIYERLGGHVTNLKYRDDNTMELLALEDDNDLSHAIATCPKLLLYAE
ncbi:3310_t:CDS:2 [Acaulospora colombiana]|uniref:3310_t:CDS:1 n=1 Tax=Acaulospora colombiana TaxID=27376 RepID=A0ACA9LWW5_9GLOM|nr:3310_t:CDS:2 [Acaulospora colombiana]